uniref:Rab proteins geranylgeranyltransferase component A n=1 Tax=Ascaris lumbricoides TaxID=6252 RepID=A0A0M3IPX5_ASCLU
MSGEEALPSDVDVVVLGTGLPESIIAAACARSGLSVLHLDRNDYYGGVWSSFHLQSIAEWVDRMKREMDADPEGDYTDITLEDGEELIPIGRNQSIESVHLQWHTVEPDTTESEQNGDMESDHPIKRDMERNWRRFSIDLLPKVLLSRGAMVQVICDSEVSKYCEFKCVNRLLCLSAKANYAEGPLQELQVVPCSRSEIFQSEAISMIEKRRIMKFLTSCMQWHEKPDEIDGWSGLYKLSFLRTLINFGFYVTVLLSRGAMVQVICDSEVSKYCEFKCVNRLLCLSAKANYAEGPLQELQVVPCSRSEIFQSEAISMIEKRRIMKFLTSCMQWHEKPDEIDGWSDFADKPFDDFIESRGISGNLKSFVADTIGILCPNATAKEGLKAVYRFMESVGRFGDSPFLWTLYGSGELPQCFCRLCAVYGGVYCLKQPIDALILKENRVVAVLTKGQRIRCKHVVMDSSYLPRRYSNDKERRNVLQRAILLSNRSLLNDAQKEHISLLNLMRLDMDASARLLEVGFEACAAPRGYCMFLFYSLCFLVFLFVYLIMWSIHML